MASDADPDAPAAGQRGRRSSGKTLTELSQVDDCNDPKMLARWTNNWSGPREGPLFEALEQRKAELLAERSLTRRVKDQPKSPGPSRWDPTEKEVRERTARKYGFRRNSSEVQRVGDSFPALLINPQPRPLNPKPRRRFARRLPENTLALHEDDEILPAETKEIDHSLGLSKEDNVGASAKKTKRDDTPSTQIPPLDAAGSSVGSEAAEIPPGPTPGAAPRAAFASSSSNDGAPAPDAASLLAKRKAALPSAGARGGPDALELAAPALKKQPSLAGMAAAKEEAETPLTIAPTSPKEAPFEHLKKSNESAENFKKKFNYDETEEPFAVGGQMRVHSVIVDNVKFVVCKSIQKLLSKAKQRMLNRLDILTELVERHRPGFLGLEDWCIEKKPEGEYLLIASLQSVNGDLAKYRDQQYKDNKSDEEIEHLVRLAARQLIESVGVMEKAFILHRDLKCENLLYFGDDNWKSGTANFVKIIDPGLAIRTADIRCPEDGLDPTRGGTAGYLSTSAWYHQFGIGSDREPAAMTLIQLAINDHPFINEIDGIERLFERKIQEKDAKWIAKLKKVGIPQSAKLFAEEMIVLANEAGILPESLHYIKFPGAAEFQQLVEELCCFCIEKRLSISAIQKLPFLTNDSEMEISNLVLQEQVSFDWTLGKGTPQEHCIVNPADHQDAKNKITSIIDERVQDGDVRKQLADRIDGIFAIAIEASSRRKSASASPAVNEKRNAAVDRLLHFEVISVDEADDIKNRF